MHYFSISNLHLQIHVDSGIYQNFANQLVKLRMSFLKNFEWHQAQGKHFYMLLLVAFTNDS